MDQMRADLAEMKTTSALVAASVKSMSETIQAMASWMLKVDKSIGSLQSAITEVGARVAMLEAEQPPATTPIPPRPHGHGVDNQHQGTALGANNAPAPALVRGKRNFPPAPVPFDLEHSAYSSNHNHGSRCHSGYLRGRMPKTDFPKFDGADPTWG